jgi:hypothetical protein
MSRPGQSVRSVRSVGRSDAGGHRLKRQRKAAAHDDVVAEDGEMGCGRRGV